MDAEFIDYVVSMIVTFSTTYAILRYDESRLSDDQLARAWPASSRNAAILAFSPICLLVHFVRTRWSVVGVLLGVGAVTIVALLDVALSFGVEAIASH